MASHRTNRVTISFTQRKVFTYVYYVYMLSPDSQPSPFQSRPASFEASWPASKWAGPIHNRWKVMARFETGLVDSFESGWVDGFETCWWTQTSSYLKVTIFSRYLIWQSLVNSPNLLNKVPASIKFLCKKAIHKWTK